jgi:ribosomal protein S18 acetylase RimI-like enzyme
MTDRVWVVPTPKGVIYRPMRAEEAREVMIMDRTTFKDRSEHFSSIRDLQYCTVADLDGALVGYCNSQIKRGFSHKKNFKVVKIGFVWSCVVLPRYRRMGIARNLFLYNFEWLKQNGVTEMFMIVRASQPAIPLYNELGFYHYKTIKDFYSEPTEDAEYLVNMGVSK